MSNVIGNGDYCVYVHTSPSGKKYVGQTRKKPEERWPIAQYSLSNEFICLFGSITEAGRNTGVDTGSISACCRGKSKTTGGFIWKYYDNEKCQNVDLRIKWR